MQNKEITEKAFNLVEVMLSSLGIELPKNWTVLDSSEIEDFLEIIVAEGLDPSFSEHTDDVCMDEYAYEDSVYQIWFSAKGNIINIVKIPVGGYY